MILDKNIPISRKINSDIHLAQITFIPIFTVLFQVLIIFFLTSSFTSQPRITVNLPKAITSDLIQEDNLIITVTSENVISFNSRIITLKELHQVFNQKTLTGRSVLIKTDRRASVGRIVEIWDLCRDHGIEKINIATNQYN
jgi:biopolymer transport protein ExbD